MSRPIGCRLLPVLFGSYLTLQSLVTVACMSQKPLVVKSDG